MTKKESLIMDLYVNKAVKGKKNGKKQIAKTPILVMAYWLWTGVDARKHGESIKEVPGVEYVMAAFNSIIKKNRTEAQEYIRFTSMDARDRYEEYLKGKITF